MGSTDKQIFDKTTWKRPLNKTLTLFIMYGCVCPMVLYSYPRCEHCKICF